MADRKVNSTYSVNQKRIIDCDLTFAIHLIGGRWKLLILDKLLQKKMRYSELKNQFSYITERMLALQLRALENDGLISRTVYAEVPPRVEYQLTETGMELSPILTELSKWAKKIRKTKRMTWM